MLQNRLAKSVVINGKTALIRYCCDGETNNLFRFFLSLDRLLVVKTKLNEQDVWIKVYDEKVIPFWDANPRS